MKKLVNDVHAVVRETLEGFALAHPDLVDVHYSPDFVTRHAPKAEGKVGLVSGGGSGHEPLHAGFVGEGMLDAAVPGAVFTSPTPDPILEATKAADRGAGEILFTSMDHDGTKNGYPCDTFARLAELPVPIIASGGAGTADHIADVLTLGRADAALAASIFHYNEIPILVLKRELKKRNINVRL